MVVIKWVDCISAQMPLINANLDVYSEVKTRNVGLVHLHPYFVYVSSKGSEHSPEPLLLTDAISKKILCTGLYIIGILSSHIVAKC